MVEYNSVNNDRLVRSIIPQFEVNTSKVKVAIQKETTRLEGAILGDKDLIKGKSLLSSDAYNSVPIQGILVNNPNLFAHIHLGASALNTGEEGLPNSASVNYLCELLKFMNPNKNDKELNALSKNFAQLKVFTDKLSEIQNQTNGENSLETFATNTARNIWDLEAGESLLMAGGYSGDPFGHAMYYQFKKNTSDSYDIFQYNGQQGLNSIQGGLQGALKNKVVPFRYYKNVPKESLFFSKNRSTIRNGFIKNLMLLNAYPKWQQGSNRNPFNNTHVDRVFQHINDFIATPPKHLSHYKTAQRSGVCSLRSLHLALLGMAPSNEYYKYLLFHSRMISLISQYKNCANASPKQRFQLRIAAENFCREISKIQSDKNTNPHISKEHLKTFLCTVKDIIAKLEEVEKSKVDSVTDTKEILSTKTHSDNSACIEESLESLEKVSWSVRYKIPSGRGMSYLHTPAIHAVKCPEPKDLKKFLSEELEYTENLQNRASSRHVSTHIENVIEALPIPSDKDTFWSKITPDEALECQKTLNEISIIYSNDALNHSNNSLPFAKTQNTHMAMLAISFELAKRVDSTKGNILEGFSLAFDHYKNLLTKDNYYTIEDSHVWKKRQQLLSYFEGITSKKSEPLFKFDQLLQISESTQKHPDINLYRKIVSQTPGLYEKLKYALEDFPHCTELELSEELRALLLLAMDFKNGESNRYQLNNTEFLNNHGYSYIVSLKRMALQGFFLMGAGKQRGFCNKDFEMRIWRKGDTTYEFKSSEWDNQYSEGTLSQVGDKALTPDAMKLLMDRSKSELTRNEPEITKENSSIITLENSNHTSEEKELLYSFTVPRIQPSSIIHFLRNNMEYLEKEPQRSRMGILLFKPVYDPVTKQERLPLFEELENGEEGFWEQCQEFIQEGIHRYYNLQPGKVPNIPMCLFYLRLAQKITQNADNLHQGEGSFSEREPLIDDKKLLKEWLNSDALSNEDKGKLHIHMLTHYMNKDPEQFQTSDWVTIYKNWVSLQTTGLLFSDSWEDQHQTFHLQRWITKLEVHLEEALIKNQNLTNTIGEEVLRYLELEEKNSSAQTSWTIKQFPLIERKNSGNIKEIWQINLSTGKIQNEFGIVKLGEITKDHNSDYNRLFGKREFSSVKNAGSTLYFKDSLYGSVRVISGDFEKGIQRKIDGQWYQYVSYNEVHNNGLLPCALIADYSHWIPAEDDESNPTKMLINDRENGTLHATWEATGKITFSNDPKKKLLDLDRSSRRELEELPPFEDNEYILIHGNDKQRKFLTFTRYLTENQIPLGFHQNINHTDKWVYNSNPNYHLAPQLPTAPLGTCQNYLCLKHVNRSEYKVLVPFIEVNGAGGYSSDVSLEIPQNNMRLHQNGTQRFFELDVKNGELGSNTVEEKLFLGYLFLLQKDYVKALSFLKEVTISDTLSYDSKDLLGLILKSGDHGKDFSPDSCAVRLHSYHLYKTLAPFEQEIEKLGEKSPHKTVHDIYAAYLDGLNNVDRTLQLDPVQELEMLSMLNSDRFSKREKVLRKEGYTQNSISITGGTQLRIDWKSKAIPYIYTYINKDTFTKQDVSWGSKEKRYEYDYGAKEFFSVLKDSPSPSYSYSSSNSNNDFLVPLDKYKDNQFRKHYDIMRNSANPQAREELVYHLQTLKTGRYRYGSSCDILKILHFTYLYPQKALKLPPTNATEDELADWWKGLINLYEKQRFVDLRKDNYCFDSKIIPSTKDNTPKVNSEASRQKVSSGAELPYLYDSSRVASGREVGLTSHNPDVLVQDITGEYLKPISGAYERTYNENELKLDPKDLSEEEKPYVEVIDAEGKIYQNEHKEGVRQNNEDRAAQFTLKDSKQLVTMHQDLKQSVDNMQKSCEAFEKLILLKINQKPLEESARHLEIAFEGGHVTKSATLFESFAAVATSSTDESQKALKKLNRHLTDDEADGIRDLIVHYLMEATTLKQLKDGYGSIDKIVELKNKGKSLDSDAEMQIFWKQATKTLTAARQYDPLTNSQALLFEHLSGLRVTQKQSMLIRNVMDQLFNVPAEKRALGVVFQLIMGGGKTSVILSQLIELSSNEDRLPLFLCHHSQYSSVLGNLKQFQKKRYNKDIIPINYTRDELSSIATLHHILKTLKSAKDKKNPIIMKTPMLQMLQLEFLSVGYEYTKAETSAGKLALQIRLEVLADTLIFIKTNCIGLFDEVDINLSILLGVHFPLGEKKHVKPERISLVKNIYSIMASDAELAPLVGLNDNKQAELGLDNYKTKVLPRLAEKLADKVGDRLKLKNSDYKASFIRYVTGKIPAKLEEFALKNKDIASLTDQEKKDVDFLKYLHEDLHLSKSENLNKAADLISLSKQTLLSLIPLTLTKSFNRAYGRTPVVKGLEEKTAGKICPYLGVGTPATTEFGYVWETICYHFQTALGDGISADQVTLLAKYMTESANHYARKNNEEFDKTAEAIEFKKLTGVELHELEKPGKLDAAVLHINKSIDNRLQFEAETAAHHATYHSMILSSTPLAAVDQLSQAIGDSGTIWNASTYHKSLQNLISDTGTEGKIIDTLLERFDQVRSNIYQVDSDDVQKILGQVINNHPTPKKIQGLTDVGGLLKRYDNITVAREILEYYDSDDRIKGVLFLYRNPKTGKESFAILKEGETEPLLLRNTTLEEIEKYGLSLEEIFVYHDELRATGTDIPEPPEAINLITIDPQNILIRSILQGVMRLRQYFLGQNADFIVMKNSAHALIDNGESLSGVFKTAIKNQAIQKGKQTYRSYAGQIENAIRNEVITDLLRNARSPNKFKELFTKFQTFIFTTFEDSPYEQYSFIDEQVKTVKVLKEIKDNRFKQFKDCGATDEQLQRTEAAIDEILVKAKKEPALTSKVTHSKHTTPAESNIEINNEKERESEVEKEYEMSIEFQNELTKYSFYQQPTAFKEINWNYEKDGEKEASFSDLSGPKVLPFSDVLKEGYIQGTQKQNYQAEYSNCFPENIKVTENFQHVTTSKLPVFHPLQIEKKGNQILVYRENNKLQFVMLSGEETPFFREWISDEKPKDVWLLNSLGQRIESNGAPLPSGEKDIVFHEQLQEGLWYVNLNNGNVDYLSKNENLTESLLEEGDTKTMLRFLELKIAKDTKQKKIFGRNATFHPFDKDFEDRFGGHKCAERLAQEENHRKRLANLTPEEVADIDLKFVPFLPNDMVCHLEKEEKIRKLTSRQVAHVASTQANFVPQAKIQFLETEEQIKAVTDPKKISVLTEEQIPKISAAQVTHIDNETIHALKNELVPHLDVIKYNYLCRDQIPSVPAENINRIPEHLVQYVATADQVKNLKDEWLKKLIKADQIGYIPIAKAGKISRDQWETLGSADTITKEGKALVHSLSDLNDYPEKLVKHCSEGQLQKIKVPLYLSYASPSMAIHLSKDQIDILAQTKDHSDDEDYDLRITKIVEKLSAQQVGDLKKNQTTLISKLTDDQLPQLPSSLFASLSEERVQKIEKLETLRVLPDVLVPLLLLSQYTKFTKTDSEKIALLSESQIKKLEATHKVVIQNLTLTQLEHLPSSCFAQLTDQQVIELDSIELIRKLTSSQFKLLEAHHIKLFNKDSKTDQENVRHLTIKQLDDLPEGLFKYMSSTQIKGIKADNTTLLNKISSEQVKHLQDTALKALPNDKKVLDGVDENRLHKLSIKQISVRNLYHAGKYAHHIAAGIGLTLVSPIQFIAELIYNLSILAFRCLCALFVQTKKNITKMKVQVQKTFVIDPALCFVRPVDIFYPAKHIQLESKLNSVLRKTALIA